MPEPEPSLPDQVTVKAVVRVTAGSGSTWLVGATVSMSHVVAAEPTPALPASSATPAGRWPAPAPGGCAGRRQAADVVGRRVFHGREGQLHRATGTPSRVRVRSAASKEAPTITSEKVTSMLSTGVFRGSGVTALISMTVGGVTLGLPTVARPAVSGAASTSALSRARVYRTSLCSEEKDAGRPRKELFHRVWKNHGSKAEVEIRNAR